MKTLKILTPIVALLVLVTGILAFAPKETKFTTITADHIVQPENLTFEPLTGQLNMSNCGSSSSRLCVYDVTPEGKANIPDQVEYSETEIQTFLDEEWIEPNPGASEALYL